MNTVISKLGLILAVGAGFYVVDSVCAEDDARNLNEHLMDGLSDPARVHELLRRGANPNMRSEFGWPVLLQAATNGYVDTVQMLIDAGADVNARDNGGWTALMLAARYEHLNVLNILLNVRNIDVNAQNSHGFTALMLAAQYRGNAAAVNALLAIPRINVMAFDRNGRTALDIARENSDDEVIELISGAERNLI